MQSKAQAKWVRMSPRKVRRVINEIRGKSAAEAVTILKFMPYSAAREVEKLLRSAMYNLINGEKTNVSEQDAGALKVVEAYADGGPTLKRIQPHARGMAKPILKRSSHITLVLSDV
ncbi:MAG: 50S ribosomal protein L22 [Candidatus Obscuribacterales bacterium]|jgi:large subunit ribosomal protein L22|nr:50S ribosomal protein L22 [Candidatus Obscuribacterales bacterium]